MINHQPKVLITASCHPWLLEKLGHSFKVEYAPGINYEELSSVISDVHGLIITTRLIIDKPLLQKAEKLQWIGRLGSGLELVDLAYAKERNIKVVSSPEGNRNAVAEHALGMLLSLLNHIERSYNQVKNGEWLRNENRGTELNGKTVGIVGYGNTGSSFARLLQPFNTTILAYDAYRFDFGSTLVREASIEQLQRYADVISFHVPLNEATYQMIDDSFLSGLQHQPYLINTSRGKIADMNALINALKEEKISGLGLDVLPNEKLDTYTAEEKEQLNWLCAQPNVLITPHIAGYSHEAYLKMAEVVYEKLFGK